jgi:hypothetical protein
MSYDPSHRMPPRQERWPAATPAEGWPSYRDGEQQDYGYAAQGATAGYQYQAQGAVATAAYPAVADGYGGYAGAADDFDGGDGYARDDYGRDSYGYDWAGPAYADEAYGGTADGYGGGAYLGPGSYVEPGAYSGSSTARADDPALTAPDAGIHPDRWRSEQARRREAGRRGPVAGAVTELLATGVVLGVSTLAAALLKSATSPVGAMAAVFAERTPAALRNAVVHHFGARGQTVLLLGMYVTFAVVAIAIGTMARRDAAVGVAGVAAFGLFAAFVTITRPAGHVADVMPVVIGGLAGVAAALWLFRASAPRLTPGPPQQRRGGTRRRTR